MSQFIDKLNRAARGAPQPMGFRTAPLSTKPQMLLVASLTAEDLPGLADRASGADAVLIRMPKAIPEAKVLQKMVRSLPDIPWGGWLKDADEKGVASIIEAGADFLVFPATSAVSMAPQGNKAGKVIQIGTTLEPGLLVAINGLPVDAVFIADEESVPLTWQQVMFLQRAAILLSKPVLASVPARISADELKTLWGIGVDGVVVAVSKEQSVDRLKELRQTALADLPPRKRGKAEALVPSIRMEASAQPSPEPEPDEDE